MNKQKSNGKNWKLISRVFDGDGNFIVGDKLIINIKSRKKKRIYLHNENDLLELKNRYSIIENEFTAKPAIKIKNNRKGLFKKWLKKTK